MLRQSLPKITVWALLLLSSLSSDGLGQQPAKPKVPFGQPFDPEAMFNTLFGPPLVEDDERLEAIPISVKDEERIGQAAVEAFLAELKRRKIAVLSRGREVDYLRELVAVLQPFMRNAERYKSITVYLADAPYIEAKSFPGGTIVVFRGMLGAAGSEAALVGVLGHELSHLDHGHQLFALRRSRLMQEAVRPGPQGFAPRQFQSVGLMLMRVSSRPFRPQDEAAADRDGVDWAYRAGYDPREMARVFRKFREQEQRHSLPLPTFFRTHPYPADRAKAIQVRYEELQRTEPRDELSIGRENLRRRVARQRQQFPE